ncbi:hypothetical protein PRZ48_007881 [Zasmidium cellare]|uniref:Agarase n=1 Tax=Zasmidium cellare TaxID=395010 RepID=A0ABR0EKN1_ZASCE|nr:hypothetical protein PRZ48_007881 [Zasmidium cellare]
MNIQDWNGNPDYVDPHSTFFKDWCAYLARTISFAIKDVDPNHLILGDRINGNRGHPDGVVQAAAEFIEILFVQYFHAGYEQEDYQRMVTDLQGWSNEAGGKPVLVADIANWCSTNHNPNRASALGDQRARGSDYAQVAEKLMAQGWCLGWHWCGYIENIGARGWGIISPLDEEYTDMIAEMRRANVAAQQSLLL